MSQIKAGAIDWRTYVGSIIYLGGNVVIGSTSSLCVNLGAIVSADDRGLPSIVKGLNYTNADAQLYTVPPYSVAFVRHASPPDTDPSAGVPSRRQLRHGPLPNARHPDRLILLALRHRLCVISPHRLD